MFASEAVTDVISEVLTFGVCDQEVSIEVWREIEVTVEFAAAEPQVGICLAGA